MRVFDALDAAVLVQDATTHIRYANAAAIDVLGLDRTTLQTRDNFDPRWDVVGADGKQLPSGEYPTAIAQRTGEAVRDLVIGVRRPQGDRVWLLCSVIPIEHPGTGERHYVATLRDISALRNRIADAEASMSAESSLYRSVLRAMAEGVVIHDPYGAIRFNNAAAERILRLSPEQLRGLSPLQTHWQLLNESGLPITWDELPAAVTRRTGLPCRNVVIGLASGRERSWLLVSTEPVPGVSGAVVTTFSDITEERNAQHRLLESTSRMASVADTLPGLIFEYERRGPDDPGRFTFLRGRTAEFGLVPEAVLADLRALVDRIHPEDWVRLHHDAELAADRAEPFVADFRLRDAEGRWRWMREHARVVRWGAGRRTTGVMLDIAEQKRLEEGMRQAQRREAMADLAAGVAHNFNNMLAVALPNIEAARETADDEQAPMLADASQAVRRAAELVKQLLYVARGDTSGRVEIVNVAEVADEVLRLCRRTFDPKIRVDVLLAPGDHRVEGSVSHLHQVILNLLLNARDALAGVTTPTIRVRLQEEPGPDGVVALMLEVSDNGCGMDEATLRRLGEPFFTTKPPGRGTGLGFASVLETLRDMGAGWTVDSAPGVGTSFRLRFPALALAH